MYAIWCNEFSVVARLRFRSPRKYDTGLYFQISQFWTAFSYV